MTLVQRRLRDLAEIQIAHTTLISVLLLTLTIVAITGAFSITLQSDLSKLDPQDIPVTQLRNTIDTEFNRFEGILIVLELDESVASDLYDIRDPRVVRAIIELDEKLREEATINEVTSIAELFRDNPPESLEGVMASLREVPEFNQVYDDAYTWTVIQIDADVGGDDTKIKALNNRIDQLIKETSLPAGVKVTTTGDAPLNSTIFTLLINDAYVTLIIATLIIFFLLIILERSIKQGFIILIPLTFGLTWTLGTMGFLNIPITIATAAMGAMLLGLGVEYAVFMYERYKEERYRHTARPALKEAIASVGATIISSGTTTLIGFLALALSAFPVLSDLGLTLAIGIFYMLAATILVFPLVVLTAERLEGTQDHIKTKKRAKRNNALTLDRIYERYAKTVADHPYSILLITIIITGIMVYGMQQIEQQDVTFETILPEDLDAIEAYITLTNHYGDDSTAVIYVTIDEQFSGSSEPHDIRDPRVIRYIDTLTQKAKTLEHTTAVTSLSDFIKEANNNELPQTIATHTRTYATAQAMNIINADYSGTIISVSVSEDGAQDGDTRVQEINAIIKETARPIGVSAVASGGLVVQSELDRLNAPDSQFTSIIAFLGIILFLAILTFSLRSTILPLLTVIISIIWILGLTGFFKVPFNNITQSVLTMIIGIGIDFGLQVVNRFNQERETQGKKEAMYETLKNILAPMVITVLAALIGFRAMALGELKVMADLGTLMSFGVASSMIIAVSCIAAITLITERRNK